MMRLFLLVLSIFSVTASGLWSAVPANAVVAGDLDIAASRVIKEGKVEPMDEGSLLDLLGLGGPVDEKAEKEKRSNRKADETVQYLIAFQKPVAIGTILGGSDVLQILKPEAGWPPDPARSADWQTIEVQSNQSTPCFAPLPPKTVTRAFLVTMAIPRGTTPSLRLLAPRLTNHTPLAVANADTEFTSAPMLSPPYTFDAGHITRGRGSWVNSGKDGSGINSRAPISDVTPSWFILSWPESRPISGVVLQDTFEKFELQEFTGPAGINAAAATENEWRTIRKFDQVIVGTQRWLTFDPIETRALRLRITKTKDAPVAKLAGFSVFNDLGDKPATVITKAAKEEPPFTIPYELANAGKVTMVIENPDGSRVRNLVANVEREAGKNTEHWNLKDEAGNFVAPGTYKWRAITHPPLELRYELTAYPNVTSLFPERPAWLTGPAGSGGWLADHTAPLAVCTTGDRVFIGAPVSESGVSLIECDLEGRKLWGHPSFAAFTGCGMLATDGKTLFNTKSAANFAKAGMEKSTEAIWAVDLATREVRTVAMLQPTAERKRGVQGFAARDNKIYLAIHSEDDWLNNAVAAADVDPLNSLPAYPPARPARAAHEVVADQQTDFLRLFRLRDTPPGQGNLGLTWLESTSNVDSQQHIMIAFKKPVAIGSLVFPPPPNEDMVQFQIAILKPGSAYPPRIQERSDWEVIPLDDKSPWAVVPLPPGTETRAIRFTFIRGGKGATDDLLSEVEGKSEGPSLDLLDAPKPKKAALGADDGSWQRKIEGMKLLSRRFENLFPTAKIHVNSGKIAPDGTWDAQRTEPISAAEPAIYAMEWKAPQSIRGLAIREIDGAITEIDAYTGPAGGAIDPNGTEGWEKIATYSQPLRNYYQPDVGHNSRARYLDGYVDFGRNVETRALRLRVVKQWDSKSDRGTGVRFDQGGDELDLKRCHVYGVAPLKYLGGEPTNDPLVTERIEVIDAKSGKILEELPLPGAGSPTGGKARGNILAFNARGDLFAIAQEKLVKIDLNGDDPKSLVSDLINPSALACDAAGNFYVFDAAKDRKNIRVYDATGKFLREIGEPGGYQAGAWNPNRMERVTALAVDDLNQVWAVDNTYWPKRVSLWSSEGKFLKEFLGPTEYGGGGAIDPGDRKRLFYGPLEFELDWEKGTSRLKNLTSLDGEKTGDIPVRVNDRLYLTNVRARDFGASSALIYLHEGDRARVVGAIGVAGECAQLLDPKLVKAFGGKVLLNYLCAWSDLNGDEKAQPNEVQLWPKPEGRNFVTFDPQLNAQMGSISFRVKEWLPNGVPVYERSDNPKLWSGMTLQLDNGNFYHFEDQAHENKIAVQKPDGTTLWTYQTEGSGVHALTKSKPIHDGQIVCELGVAGHATAHAGDLGEFVVFNTNTGLFNLMTADGLFAGQIFSDIRDRERNPWSSAENARGTRLDETTLGQEHFSGYFCRTADNRYYAVVGHNHASVVEVIGMDRFKRFDGEITVTAADLTKTQEWESVNAARRVYAKAPVIDCYRVSAPPKLDGKLTDWPAASAQIDDQAKFRIGYDDQYLYLAYEITGRGPLKNQGQQWDRLFKSGAAIDLQIGLDANAPADRKTAIAGDQRLLLTFMGEQPTAVIYQAVVPGTPPDKAWQVVSPVGSASFDRVVKLDKIRLFASGDGNSYIAEAAIPLAELGLKITPGLRLKMDWGILASGPNGTEVLQREYWANKFTQITADAPSEAELHPNLWGHVRFHGETADAHLDPATQKSDAGVDDLLNELK